MVATNSTIIYVQIYQTTRYHTPEDHNINIHRLDKLESCFFLGGGGVVYGDFLL
jgi:hypothetical protein